MHRTHLYIALLFCVFQSFVNCQTGPGGVGNSTNNVLWLKADAGTSTTVAGVQMSAWNDASGNGVNVSQPLVNQQPVFQTNIMNGFPSVWFDNVSTTNDKMLGPDSPLLDNTAGYSFFTVSRPQSLNCNSIVSKRVDVGVHQSFMLFYYTGNTFQVDVQSNNDRFASLSTFANNNNYLIDLIYDGSLPAASRSKLYIGESLNRTAYETSASVPDNNSVLCIGTTHPDDPRPFGGYISEVIIYREALNKPSRIIVNNHLSSKYDIALTANDKYLGDTPANGDYDRDVSGIGTDTLMPGAVVSSNLSFSSSATMGFGLTQVSGFQAGDYILAGHRTINNAAILTDVAGMTVTPGQTVCRWNRIWYVDVTNFGADPVVNVLFDMSDGGVSPAISTPANYKLLYRAGQTGSWTEVATASGISGDQIQFSNYTMISDGYYTIGSLNCMASPLPVVLSEFSASAQGRTALLSWTTSSQVNSDHFDLFHSQDGIQWEHVHSEAAAGNSQVENNYTFTDEFPHSGVNYYKLELTDQDGSVQELGTRSVNFDQKAEWLVYPNPADDAVYISTTNSSIGDLELFDNQGRCVLKDFTQNSSHSIDLGQFSAGVYYLHLGTETIRVVKN